MPIKIKTYAHKAVEFVTDWTCFECGRQFYVDGDEFMENGPKGDLLILPCPHCSTENTWILNK